MFVELQRQLVADRVDELQADARRARQRRERRAHRAAEARESRARREWQALVDAIRHEEPARPPARASRN
jgi:hypothetical protein